MRGGVDGSEGGLCQAHQEMSTNRNSRPHNSRLERTGPTPSAQPDRSPHLAIEADALRAATVDGTENITATDGVEENASATSQHRAAVQGDARVAPPSAITSPETRVGSVASVSRGNDQANRQDGGPVTRA